MNLYGFAGGNPVSYSYPFGLCVGPLAVICVAIAANGPEIAAIGAGAVAMLEPGPGVGALEASGSKLAAKAGEASFTKAGRQAHKLWDAGENFVKEFTLPAASALTQSMLPSVLLKS